MELQQIIEEIRSRMSGPTSVGLTQLGLSYKVNYGVPIPELSQIAEMYKGNHRLALELFDQDIRECKIIASMIADPEQVTGEQIDNWAQSFTNIEIVEQVCSNLLWKTDCALSRSIEWCLGNDELLQKAGLIIVARSASKEVKDAVFEPYIELIDNYDEQQIARNKISIEFALRQIGQRNVEFKGKVIELAQRFADSDDEHKAWIGGQLLFEFDEEDEP